MQVAAWLTARGLARRAHEVHVFTTSLKGFSGDLREDDLFVHHVSSPTGKYSSEYFDGARRLFDSLAPFDIVYSHSTAARRHVGGVIPVVAHWHGIGGIEDVKNLSKIGHIVPPKKFDPEILRYPRHIAVGPHEARYIVSNGIDENNVRTVLYGVDGFTIDPIKRAEIRSYLGYGDEHFVVGVSGRLVTDKGIGQVAAIVHKLSPHVRILIIGAGGFEKVFKERSIYQETVERKQMCGYYNAMDLLIDPTARNQGFDITPIEAVSCGTPVLLSDVGSYKEVFTKGARFFELGNLDQLAKQINEIASSSTILTLRSEALQIASERFTLDRMVDEVEEELRSAISTNHQPIN
jgi:glycosyltransferase involved in cell wall biosynthesis